MRAYRRPLGLRVGCGRTDDVEVEDGCREAEVGEKGVGGANSSTSSVRSVARWPRPRRRPVHLVAAAASLELELELELQLALRHRPLDREARLVVLVGPVAGRRRGRARLGTSGD